MKTSSSNSKKLRIAISKLCENIPHCNFNFYDFIPEPILVHILGYLDIPSLCRCSRTCSRWNELVFNLPIWREKVTIAGILDSKAVILSQEHTNVTDIVQEFSNKELKRLHINFVSPRSSLTEIPK